MLASHQNKRLEFYEHIGILYYAIASADNTVRTEELTAVKNLVEKYWLPFEAEIHESNSKESVYILDTFKKLQTSKVWNSDDCYTRFINYKEQHVTLFTNSVRALLLKTASKIADSFASTNKSELILLAKLSIDLKKES